MRRVSLLIVLAGTVALFGQAATADPINVVASGDAFVTDGPNGTYAIYNYGGAGGVEVSGAAAGRPDQSPNHRGQADALIRFNLASVKASFDSTYGVGQWAIQSAVLNVCAQSPASSGHYNNAIFNDPHSGQFSVQWLDNDSWVEGAGSPGGNVTTGITWNTLNSFQDAADLVLGTFSYTPPPAGGATNNRADNYTLALPTDFVTDLKAGSDVSLLLSPADSSVSLLFSSRTNSGQPPVPTLMLTVAPVPEPGTMTMLAVGGLSVLAVWRRRRAS